MSKEKLIPEFRFPEFKDSGEWDVKTLGEVLIKNSKKNKNQKYSQVESVSNKFGFIKQDEYFKNRRVASKDTSNYYVIKKGYFAYNPSRIDVGSLAYKHNDEISIISPLYVSFKANNELINDYFLLSFFNSVTFTKQMIFEGGVRNTLNYDNLIQSKIPIPTIQEQQRIASCLSSLDEVIEAHSKKLELLKDHKKGLLQNLFPQEGETVPKVRFPEFEEDGEWVERKLGEVFNTFSGGTPKSTEKKYYGGSTPFIRSAEIAKNSTELFLTDEGLKNSSAKLVKKGDLLIALYGANSGDVAISKIDGAINQAILCLRSDFSNEFVSHYFFLKKDWITRRYLQGGQGNLSGQIVKSIELYFPKQEEQQKIASCLSVVDELITAQKEKIEQLQQHKKGLMQGLFPKIES